MHVVKNVGKGKVIYFALGFEETTWKSNWYSMTKKG